MKQIAQRPGLWLRAGMGGAIVGLDWRVALDLIPPDADRELAIDLLAEFELGMLEGASEKQPDAERSPKG